MFSCFLALHRLPIAATAIKFTLGCLIFLSNHRYCIRSTLLSCKGYLVFILIAFVFSRSLALHRPPITAAVVESTLGYLVLLSNCHYCIWSALSSCKGYLVFLLLLLYCGVLAFCLCKCQLNLFCLRLRVDLKRNRFLITPKSCHSQRSRSPFVSTPSYFSPNSSPTPQTHPTDLSSI